MSGPIQPADTAEAVPSDDDKAKNAAAEAAAEHKAKPAQRFVEYVVPRRNLSSYVDERGKRRPIVSRPSEAHRHASVADDGTLSSSVGAASARARITPQDWATNGIAGATDTLVWDFTNDWRVPAAKLTDEQIDFLLVEDPRINKLPSPRFALVDGNGHQVDH